MRVLLLLCLLGTWAEGYAQCFTDRHSTILEDAWVSCEQDVSPNSARGLSHWIMYDFNEVHRIGTSKLWNINTPGLTEMGAQSLFVDYSIDGTTWLNWGEINLSQAPGSGFYEGEDGPDFGGLEARYVLLTVNANYGHSCAGLAEVRIENLGMISNTEETLNNTEELDIFPNPARESATVLWSYPLDGPGRIQIFNSASKLVREYQTRFSSSNQQELLELDGLASGQYIVILSSGNQSLRTRLTIIK